MLDSINPKKLKEGRFRRMVLEIYYENIFEKDEYPYDKILKSFHQLTTGFGRAKFILSDDAEDSIRDIQRQIKQLKNDEKDEERLWELIEKFFSDNLETDVEKALVDYDYKVAE